MEEKLKQFEEDIFSGKEINTNDFYQLKKDLLDSDNSKLLQKQLILDQML